VSAPPAVARSRSRQAALQVLYAVDLGARGAAEPAEAVLEAVAEHFELPPGARIFAAELVAGVAAAREELDALLARHARNWKLSRMAAVDRNVLRIGAWELCHSDAPTSVILDEAIELARRFGAESSPAFVNGVLDAVARAVRPGTPFPQPRIEP
jgi:N utilization substance protein B